MNYAIILAGGTGKRIGASIPKQFIKINGKPILVYTLEKFENHPLVDSITVVCVEGWDSEVRLLSKEFNISKLSNVVTGGNTALQSIRRGYESLNPADDDIIIIHDGVRPLVDEVSISNVINDCILFGGAISSVPLIEHVFFVGNERSDLHYIPRENAFRTVTPQAYSSEKMKRAFIESDKSGKGKDSPFIGIMMMDVGEKVVLSIGSEKNIKITDPNDILYFKSLY